MKMLENKKYSKKFMITNILLILLASGIVFSPLFITKNADFTALDDQSKTMISEIDKNYKPWFQPIWQPPNAEVSSMLFCLQAAIGAGFIGYFIGIRSRKNNS